jgi:hypothetical protein
VEHRDKQKGQAKSTTYSECVSVALVIQHVKRMLRIILSSVSCPALPLFFTLTHKMYYFCKKKLLKTKRVLIFSTNFGQTSSYSVKNSARYYQKFIQVNQLTRCISLSDLLLVFQIQLNMFRASLCPSSGAYKLQ